MISYKYNIDFLSEMASALKALASRSNSSDDSDLPWAIWKDKCLYCRICNIKISDNNFKKMNDLDPIVEHGISHLKEHNLLVFI